MFPPGLLTFLAVLLSLSASVTALVSQLEPQGNSSQTAAGHDKVGGDLCWFILSRLNIQQTM